MKLLPFSRNLWKDVHNWSVCGRWSFRLKQYCPLAELEILQVFNTRYVLGKIDLSVCEFCPSVREYATAIALPSIMNR